MQAYLYLSKVECDRLANTLRRDETKDRGGEGMGRGKGPGQGNNTKEGDSHCHTAWLKGGITAQAASDQLSDSQGSGK